MKLSRLAASVALVSVAFACSKPKEPTPEITEPAPTASTGATAMPAPASSAPASTNAEVSLATVYFDFDSYSIRSDAQSELRRVAGELKANAGTKIQIEGHCDERGSNEYNLALGERRARAIQEFLTSEGLSGKDLSTISYGEERPAVQGSSEDAWSKNRRGEFRRM